MILDREVSLTGKVKPGMKLLESLSRIILALVWFSFAAWVFKACFLHWCAFVALRVYEGDCFFPLSLCKAKDTTTLLISSFSLPS